VKREPENIVASRPLSTLVDGITADLPAMIDEIERLVACESPSRDLAAVAKSAEVVAAVGTARLGTPPEVIEIDGCTHLRWRFGDSTRQVLVLCHHDTVWPIGSIEQHPVLTSDGILRGPGCLDMKAGVVMAIRALAAITDRAGVTLLVTGDEEIGSPTSRTLIEDEARECQAVLVLEAAAPGGALKIERKGRAHYTIDIKGRSAHAGLEPEKGVNAAVELAHQVLRAETLADHAVGTTVTPSLVAAGSSANTVPDRGSFTIDVRASSRAELERVDAAIRDCRPVLDDAAITVAGGIDRPPMPRSASAELFQLASELAAKIGLEPLTGAAVGGGSDGNLTAALGIATLDGLGASGEGPHAAHEHVLVDELPHRTSLVALLIMQLLSQQAATVGPRAWATRA
jgi:glutamate carboxypeptidase